MVPSLEKRRMEKLDESNVNAWILDLLVLFLVVSVVCYVGGYMFVREGTLWFLVMHKLQKSIAKS